MKRLYIELGGMRIKKFGLWIPDGLHLWWKSRGVHLFWHVPQTQGQLQDRGFGPPRQHKRIIRDTDPSWNK